jgi:hypothetical protein
LSDVNYSLGQCNDYTQDTMGEKNIMEIENHHTGRNIVRKHDTSQSLDRNVPSETGDLESHRITK